MIARLLHLAVLVLAVAAVVLSTLERRPRGRLPVAAFIRETFQWSPGLMWPASLAVAAGAIVVAAPATLFAALGWVRWIPVGPWPAGAVGLAAATLIAKILLAATEELVFRGAMIEQVARRTTLGFAVAVSSMLFALAHLGRADVPGPLALLVYLLDGVGFSFVYLATGSLWVPTCWHAAKNVAIWLLYSRSTLQFADGLARAEYLRSDVWVGGPSTTGVVDLIVTLLVVSAAVRIGVARARSRPRRSQKD